MHFKNENVVVAFSNVICKISYSVFVTICIHYSVFITVCSSILPTVPETRFHVCLLIPGRQNHECPMPGETMASNKAGLQLMLFLSAPEVTHGAGPAELPKAAFEHQA